MTFIYRLNESSIPSRVHIDRSPRSSIDENSAVFSKDLGIELFVLFTY
jgi:hypothetical protein